MPIRRVEYKGTTIKAGAFEVVGLGRFIPILTIERTREFPTIGNAMLVDPPCPQALFETSEDALDQTIAFGKAVIDGEIPGLTIADL